MTTLLALLLVATPVKPSFDDLDRFPNLGACHARIRALLEARFQLQLRPKSPERETALRANSYRLEAWENLLVARGGLAEEEDGDDSTETRQKALEELHRLLGDKDYREGRMP
jgi:hypothetical protein